MTKTETPGSLAFFIARGRIFFPFNNQKKGW